MRGIHPLARASQLAAVGKESEALAVLDPFVGVPDPRLHLLRAEWLRSTGDLASSIDSLRKVTEIDPRFGAAWLGLAERKGVRFSDDDIAAMRAVLSDSSLHSLDRIKIHFALGQAWEDDGRYGDAFTEFAEANRLQREHGPGDPFDFGQLVDRQIQLVTKAFLSERLGVGDPDKSPIFIVGMHRAGSTLLEQILASHPEIEGTSELPYVGLIANTLRQEGESPLFVDRLPEVAPERFATLGASYVDAASRHRQSSKPRFIDKRPANWMAVGLIHLMLPKAVLIDVRRNPLDCCLANFKHFFEVGDMSRSLTDMGRFYAAYVSLMAHFDEVLPGRIHRVHYEELVRNPEAEVRSVLAHVGVDYDPACLRFHDNERTVRTASAEQVREPISDSSIGRWRNYEPWLDPLREALGPVLDEYPLPF
jgi:tetratricopeptide (TPR) repeat protein